MPLILTVEKSGSVVETRIKSDEIGDLYKKVGYKTAEELGNPAAVWSDSVNSIHVYGKTKGRAGQENKYDFPPPIDNTLFFGNVILVCVKKTGEGSEKIGDLSLAQWEIVYERLFGGFEDLVDSKGNAITDDETEEESEEGLALTKNGYHKDGFVVDDDDSGEEDYDPEEDRKPKKKVRVRRVNVKNPSSPAAESATAAVQESPQTKKLKKQADESSTPVKKERKKKGGKFLASLESAVLSDEVEEIKEKAFEDLGTSAELVEEDYV